MDGLNPGGQAGGQPPAAPVATAPQPSTAAAQTQQMQVPPHLFGLMTNPALAAAAAASPLFPPAAMLSNPGAYLAMPEAFNALNSAAQANGAANGQTTAGAGNTTTTTVMPNLGAVTNPIQAAQMLQLGGFAAAQAASGQATGATTGPPTNTPIAPMMTAFQANPAFAMPVAPTASAALATSTAAITDSNNNNNNHNHHKTSKTRRADLTPEEKAKQNRDRNREHARSTRLRKKAYVQKLKELVEGLHAERTEEVRQRRVAIQALAEMQNVRRSVVRSFLSFHSDYETDARKWSTILEDDFWLKQPVTPYRSFRRAEIEQECRIVRGIPAMICDSASLSVMIESIGSRSPRWMQIKREEFLLLEEARRGTKKMPRCILRQDSRLQHAVSSLSSSSGSSNHASSSGEDSNSKLKKHGAPKLGLLKSAVDASNHKNDSSKNPNGQQGQKVSLSSHCSSRNNSNNDNNQDTSKDFLHDYHAKPLPDPKLRDSEGGSEMAGEDTSPEDSNASSAGDTKRVSTDCSSGDDSAAAIAGPRATKKRKLANGSTVAAPSSEHGSSHSSSISNLPPNVAKKGGIPHNIQPVGNGAARLSMAPAVALPDFSGIGKRTGHAANSISSSTARMDTPTDTAMDETTNQASRQGSGPAVISNDNDSSSTSSGSKATPIKGYYHINEDDMILMEDVMMCPFIFRSQDAVLCGALAECVMPGMLRASFSSRNKLQSIELVYDAMGFMQQLERASGNEGTAQIIPGSLEMALSPSTTEALVITLAEPPFLIVNVNEVWTRTTGYTQMEVEGQEYMSLLEGEGTVAAASNRPGRPRHDLVEVSKGQCACSTNIHYDKDGRDFIEFVCSYPLTNANDEVTHLLHVSKELPSFGAGSR